MDCPLISRSITLHLAKMLIFVLAIFPVSQAFAKPIESYRWVESRSENFVVRSTLSKGKTESIVEHLELLRATILTLTPTENKNLPRPKVIYVFDGHDDYVENGYVAPIVGSDETYYKAPRGFLVDSDGTAILTAIATQPDEYASFHLWSDALRVYVHFLHGDEISQALPAWYRFGIEQFLAGARKRKALFEVGEVRWWKGKNAPHFQLHPAYEIISGDFDFYATDGDLHGDEWDAFLAQSWLLVDYLLNHSVVDQSLGESLNVYMRLVAEEDMDKVTAFETAFGILSYELQPRLLSYLRHDCCRLMAIPVDDLVDDFDAETIKLSKEQVSLGLAKNAMLLGDLNRAEYWYAIAIRDDALAAEARLGLAAMAKTRHSNSR